MNPAGFMADNTLAAVLSDGVTLSDYDASLGVTGTLNASASANQAALYGGVAGPLLQATEAAQPIYLPFTGQKYLANFGVSGNKLSTPQTAGNTLSGDMSVVIAVALNSVSSATNNGLMGQYSTAGQRNWHWFQAASTGKLGYFYSTDGTTGVGTTSTVTLASVGLADAQLIYLGMYHDVDNGASGNDVYFYWSTDKITWTQLGTTVTTAGAVTRAASTDPILAWHTTATAVLTGKGYRAELYSGNYFAGTGTRVVDANAADWPETATNGATQASSTTGEVWTLSNTAIAKPAMIVASSMMGFDGTAQFIAATYPTSQPITTYDVEMLPIWTNGKVISDGVSAGTMRVKKSGVTPAITLDAGSEVASNTGHVLRAWHIRTTVLNGAGSSVQIDENAPTTGDAGAGNPGGWTMGADGASLNFGSVWKKRSIMRLAHDSAAKQVQVRALLRARYGTP